MDKFWKYVDWLIPDDKKKTITDEEAEQRVRKTSSDLSKIQTQQT